MVRLLKWPAGVDIVKRLVGVCLWYQVASRCVDIVRIDLSVCVQVVSRCVDIVRIDLSVCVQVASRCVNIVRIDLSVCRWYLVVSRCVNIVRIDLSVCAYGTKWSVGVLILSKETCRCVLPTLITNNLKNIQNIKWSYCCEFNMIDSDFIITILIDRLFMYTLYV